MKQNITLSALRSGELARLVEQEAKYQEAQARALPRLESPVHLHFRNKPRRDSRHDRQGLR